MALKMAEAMKLSFKDYFFLFIAVALRLCHHFILY